MCRYEQIPEATPYKAAILRPLTSHLTDPLRKTRKNLLATASKVRTNTWVTFSYGLLHMDTPLLADKQTFTFISSVLTLDAVLRTYQTRLLIGTDGKGIKGILAVSTPWWWWWWWWKTVKVYLDSLISLGRNLKYNWYQRFYSSEISNITFFVFFFCFCIYFFIYLFFVFAFRFCFFVVFFFFVLFCFLTTMTI